jgi:hypothetical protein
MSDDREKVEWQKDFEALDCVSRARVEFAERLCEASATDVNRLFPNSFNKDNSVRAGHEVKVPRPGALSLVYGVFGDELIQTGPPSRHPSGSSTVSQTGFHPLPASTPPASRLLFVLDPPLIGAPSNLAAIARTVGGYPLPRL